MAPKKMMLLSWLIGFSAPTLAGDRKGNGGDVLVCGDTGMVFLLDFFEATERFQWDISKPAGESPTAIALAWVEQLRTVDPVRWKSYRDQIATFEEDTHFWPGITLPDVPDSSHIGIPAGCEIEQIAIAIDEVLPGEKPYTISQDLWDLLDDTHRAGLMIHEVVFRDLRNSGHENSISSRYFTGWLASEQPDRGDDIAYRQLLEELTIPFVSGDEVNGSVLCSSSTHFPLTLDDYVVTGELCPRVQTIEIREQPVAVEGKLSLRRSGDVFHLLRAQLAQPTRLETPTHPMLFSGTVSLYRDGYVYQGTTSDEVETPIGPLRARNVRFSCSTGRGEYGWRLCLDDELSDRHLWYVRLDGRQMIDTPFGPMSNFELNFHPQGLAAAELDHPVSVQVGPNTLEVVGSISWHPNGAINSALLTRDQDIFWQGKTLTLNKSHYFVSFHPDGSFHKGDVYGTHSYAFGDDKLSIGQYISFSPQGNAIGGHLAQPTTVNLNGQRVEIQGAFRWNDQNQVFESAWLAKPSPITLPWGSSLIRGRIDFDTDGSVKLFKAQRLIAGPPSGACHFEIVDQNVKRSHELWRIELEAGAYACLKNPESARLEPAQLQGKRLLALKDDLTVVAIHRNELGQPAGDDLPLMVPVRDQRIQAYGDLLFHDNGYLKVGRLKSNESLIDKDESIRRYLKDSLLHFDDEGRVLSL